MRHSITAQFTVALVGSHHDSKRVYTFTWATSLSRDTMARANQNFKGLLKSHF